MKQKYKYHATDRANAPGALFSSNSLWEVLRFVAFFFKTGRSSSITIYREKR